MIHQVINSAKSYGIFVYNCYLCKKYRTLTEIKTGIKMTTKFDIAKLKAQAVLGNAEAMYVLSTNYFYGIGVDVDFEKAHDYLEKAAKKNFLSAKILLPSLFVNNGLSMEVDQNFMREQYDKFKRIFQNADKGVPEDLYLKAVLKLSDGIEDYRFFCAVKDLQKACRKGYAPALFALGRVYHLGKRIQGKESEGLSMILQAAGKEYMPAIDYMVQEDPESVYNVVKHLAEKPDSEGEVLHLLASYYETGIVVGKDINQAIAYLEKGVALGNPQCMHNLGGLLWESEDYPHDYKRAFELFSKAAESNLPGAYNDLGTCYKRAIGTPKDKDKALSCYIKASEHGSMEAYWNLYLYYMDGCCVERDFFKAVEWLKKGDEAGLLICTYQLTKHIMNGDGIEESPEQYFFYMHKAAIGGYKEAFVGLANCYRDGTGTAKDGAKAFAWYRKAAEFSIDGVALLGQCYTYGIGTPRNNKKAVELYQIAAEHGHAQAQFDLAICYRQGEGVETDPLMAIKWYTKAAAQGHGGALCNLGVMYDNGIGVEKDFFKAFGFFKKSAEAGNVQGQFCLGDMYFSGRGTEQNYEEAFKWFSAAASQGEPDSMYHLAICYTEGLGVDKDPNKADQLLFAAANQGFQPAIDAIIKHDLSRLEDGNNMVSSNLN